MILGGIFLNPVPIARSPGSARCKIEPETRKREPEDGKTIAFNL